MPEVTVERWGELYDRAFPQVYRALVAATLDRERALDGLHDAFEEGLRNPPRAARNLEGGLYRGALRKTRRSLFRVFRERPMTETPSEDPTRELLQRLEVGRLLVLLTERQRAIVVAPSSLGLQQGETGAR